MGVVAYLGNGSRCVASMRRTAKGFVIVTIACMLGIIHYWHASTMFENDTNFSQISPLAREMTLRTEMGFYYSFYKTVVEENVFLHGIARLTNDRTAEYPDEVNAINRFNIYPEIMAGVLYRYLLPWLQKYNSILADPIFMYLETVWWCAGGTLAALFLAATALCGNIWGGLLAAAQYMGNHCECTRVSWAPNQRENLAQPFLMMQMALVTLQLRRDERRANTITLQATIIFLNCASLLFWQFSQFVLLTQLAIVFAMEQLRIINSRRLMLLLHSHFCGLHIAVMCTQGNEMLLTSIYTSFFTVVSLQAIAFNNFKVRNIQTKLDLLLETGWVCLRIMMVVTASLIVKGAVCDFLGVKEDSHITDILLSKFSSHRTFHSMLYTCSECFAFLPTDYFLKVTKTGLIPLVGISISNVLYHWMFVRKRSTEVKEQKKEKAPVKVEESTDDSGIENSSECNYKQKKSQLKSSSKCNNELEETGNIKKKDDNNQRSIEKDDSMTEKSDSPADKDLPIDKKHQIIDNKSPINKNETIDNKTPLSDKKSSTNKKSASDKAKRKPHKLIVYLRGMDIDPGIFYNMSQMFVFGLMAVIIMRLKLLFTPHLCIVASLATQPVYYSGVLKRNKRALELAAVVLLAVSAYNGYQNFALERSYLGEYRNPPLEQTLRWAMERTSARSVWAAPLPVAAAVLASARRAVMLHPHYEHAALRKRAYAVYKMYGRFSPVQLHAELSKYKVTYLILDKQECYGKSSMGCTFEAIWDAEEPTMRDQPRLCDLLLYEDVPHFSKMYENEMYAILRLHDYSLRYTPRLLDT